MSILHPFKRDVFVARTSLSPEDACKAMVRGMDLYNRRGLERCLMVTNHGDRFSAHIEPLRFNKRGTASWMGTFVVEARGTFSPVRDGRAAVMIGFRPSISLFQVIWRLILVGLLYLTVLAFFQVRAAPPASAAFAMFLVLLLPWSMVAFLQGMRQANKDWRDLREAIRVSLGSHAFEPARHRRGRSPSLWQVERGTLTTGHAQLC